MNALSINNLNKSFGDNQIINNLSLEVPEHSVLGFVGKNGAGKTTTMKMILGLLKADSGSIEVFDEKVVYGQNKTNKMIGYLPDVPEFYNYMTCKQYLKLCGEICGLSKETIKQRTEELLELVGLSNNNKKIGGFSRGMKQRLGIAQALINKPKLLICDEPTSALDPIGRNEILDILSEIKNDTTVIFSTHILTDVERICDNVAILQDGKIAMQGNVNDLKTKEYKEQFYIEFSADKSQNEFIEHAKNLNEFTIIKNNNNSLTIELSDSRNSKSQIIKALAKQEIVPEKFEVIKPSLEKVFMEIVK